MKTKGKKRLANGLILAGALLMAIGLGYEAASYPWRMVLSQLGVAVPADLPAPSPLAAPYTTYQGGGPVPTEGALVELPAQGGLLRQRPPMELTLMGTIKLPKLGVSENIVAGAGDELLYGVGHLEGTALPGQPGNSVLAGHRNYIVMHPFRHLDKLGEGDRVVVEDSENRYTYQVYRTQVVEPTDTWVTEPQEGEEAVLTLITCTPVLSPTHRLIVWARLTDTAPLPTA